MVIPFVEKIVKMPPCSPEKELSGYTSRGGFCCSGRITCTAPGQRWWADRM